MKQPLMFFICDCCYILDGEDDTVDRLHLTATGVNRIQYRLRSISTASSQPSQPHAMWLSHVMVSLSVKSVNADGFKHHRRPLNVACIVLMPSHLKIPSSIIQS